MFESRNLSVSRRLAVQSVINRKRAFLDAPTSYGAPMSTDDVEQELTGIASRQSCDLMLLQLLAAEFETFCLD